MRRLLLVTTYWQTKLITKESGEDNISCLPIVPGVAWFVENLNQSWRQGTLTARL